MNAMDAAIPPNSTNPLAPHPEAPATRDINATHAQHAPMNTNTPHVSHGPAGPLSNDGHSTTHATTGAHVATEPHHSKMDSVKAKLHDIKETLQRDHHHGQDCAKKPQDGKTNPME